jgi:alkyl sulfatase BDS1-like metallo-beta-lactamase superfamily hydrolase
MVLRGALLATLGLVVASADAKTPAATPASPATVAANKAALKDLPVLDGEDEDFAARGFIATWDKPTITRADGGVAWDFRAYANLAGPAPDTVNPSLWRHAQLLAKHGLFKVSDRIYQVRGFDISNLTIIEGDTGLILADVLTSTETAAAALALYRKHVANKPVVAVIYSHSHGDHFGGVRGVVDEKDVAAGKVQIIAPAHFMEHAVGENVIAGPAMSRRAGFQFGVGLEAGPLGAMSSGIGPALPTGTISLIPPTREIKTTGETLTLDGVTIEFQMTPGTEAPSEMNFYLPQFRALFMAENANASMHNILTPRGALVRDAKVWADGLNESLRRYGDRTDVMLIAHAWPRFGQARVADFLASHADAYKLLHDQSVRLMNEGYVGSEIAERLKLPEPLAKRWFNRGYYGTMSHNSKAVYQRYMGWYEGNPARLNPLPPEEAGKRYVAAMGGAKAVMAQAAKAAEKGEYRWAAQLLDHVVFAEPGNEAAQKQLADVHRQLAYQSESAIWRNMYLRAAKELTEGSGGGAATTANLDLIRATPTAMIFDLLAVRLDPDKAVKAPMTVAFVFPDRQERVHVTIRNGVLSHAMSDAPADVTITQPRAAFLAALFAPGSDGPTPQVTGDRLKALAFRGLFKPPPPVFNIVEP